MADMAVTGIDTTQDHHHHLPQYHRHRRHKGLARIAKDRQRAARHQAVIGA